MRSYSSGLFTVGSVAFALSIGTLAFMTSPSDVQAARPAPAPVEKLATFGGIARVVDGDTLDVGVTRVRLEGIDAPEHGQTCHRRYFGQWPCGYAATEFLQKLVEGKHVDCQNRGPDKYGRTLGICILGNQDINAEMVRHGLAWAFVKYSSTYVTVEAEARTAARGIWQSRR